MIDLIEYTDKGDNYKKPKRHLENEVHNIRLYCNHSRCKTYIKGREGYNGSFTAETGQIMDLRNDMFICNFHAPLYEHLKKAVFENKVCKLHVEDFKHCEFWNVKQKGCTFCKYYIKENENTMTLTHTLKEIVKDTEAIMTHVCEGKVYYEIVVYTTEKPSGVYQLEIDSNDDEWKATYIYPRFKAITLMRWIRKGFENGKLIQIK